MSAEIERHAALIIGAGPAGLSIGARLADRGVDVLVLEGTEVIGSSWRTRYDELRLNTDRLMARQPGWFVPPGRWPTRDDFVAYLEAFRERHRIPVRFGTTVQRIERREPDWLLHTDGGMLASRFLIIATGRDRLPRMPRWAGIEEFQGELLHASEYRRVTPFVGRDVLIVGIGNSGTEIATQLALGGARRVRVATRTPPNLVPANLLGIPITLWARVAAHMPSWIVDPFGRWIQRAFVGDLSAHGLGQAPMGIATELKCKGLGPVIDRGFTAAVRAGSIELVAALERFDAHAVCLGDDSRIDPEVVIAATGYRYGLEDLVGHLSILTPSGEPAVRDGRCHPAAPGLFFHGYWLELTGELAAMRHNARRIAAAILDVRN